MIKLIKLCGTLLPFNALNSNSKTRRIRNLIISRLYMLLVDWLQMKFFNQQLIMVHQIIYLLCSSPLKSLNSMQNKRPSRPTNQIILIILIPKIEFYHRPALDFALASKMTKSLATTHTMTRILTSRMLMKLVGRSLQCLHSPQKKESVAVLLHQVPNLETNHSKT